MEFEVCNPDHQATGAQDAPLADGQTAVSEEEWSSWEDLGTQVKQVEWLWPGWIPTGLVTILGAYPGEGKTAFALWLVRTLTTAGDWPDGQPGPPERSPVIWCESEGAQGPNIDRARKFGIRLDHVRPPLPPGREMEEFRIDSEEHMGHLRRVIEFHEPALVVLDSLSASHGVKENETKVREVVAGLRRVAVETGTPILAIHHVRKAPNTGRRLLTLDDLRGSSAIAAEVRSVIGIDVPNANGGELKRVVQLKNNYAPKQPPFGFHWEPGPGGSLRLVFGEAPSAPGPQPTQHQSAVEFLSEILAYGRRLVSEIKDAADAKDLTWATVKKAKLDLGAIHTQNGNEHFWSLPTAS